MAFDNAKIGASTIIEPGAEIGFRCSDGCGPARIGAHGIIRRGTLIYGDVSIADHFQSGHNTTIRGKVRNGRLLHRHQQFDARRPDPPRHRRSHHVACLCAVADLVWRPGVRRAGDVFLNEKLPGRVDRPPTPRGATIKDDVLIGGGCTILPGVTIGERSFVAAGTLVTKDIPPRSFVVCRPARIEPLPDHLDHPKSAHLWQQQRDLCHTAADNAALDWPADWPERY